MDDGDLALLVAALLEGDQERSVFHVRKLLERGTEVETIVVEGIGAAMDGLDGKCTIDQFNLLEIMLAGRAVMGVMKELFPGGAPPEPGRGTVVIASLEGDVHDLGKNIVKMVLTGKGYRIIDCGKDCSLDKLIEVVERERADAIGISGLITTVIPQVRKVRELLAQRGLNRVRTLAGGAALKQASAEMLQMDFVADTVFDGVRYLDSQLP